MGKDVFSVEAVRNVVQKLITEDGFEPPLYMTAVGVNGGMMHSSIALGPEQNMLQTDILADYYPDGEVVGLKKPVNIMITDKRGHAAKIKLRG